MELWFTEKQEGGFGITLQITKTLCQVQSAYQKIDILQTAAFGRMLVLDGMVMTTERDEYLYHEMLVHPALCCHPHPREVLVIGGGDGGTVREVLRHDDVESVHLVELDEEVVRLSQEYLPSLSQGFTEPRVQLYFQDGVAFVAEKEAAFDLILIDSTDPVGPARELVSPSFYRSCRQALRPGGILALQSESPLVHHQEIRNIYNNLHQIFPQPRLYLGPVTTYPAGYWSFGWASLQKDPLGDFLEERAQAIEDSLRYYNRDIHRAAFALPTFVQKLLQEALRPQKRKP